MRSCPDCAGWAETLRLSVEAAERVALDLAHAWNATQGPHERSSLAVTADVLERIRVEFVRLSNEARERREAVR